MNRIRSITLALSALVMIGNLSFGVATIAQATGDNYGGDDPGWSACKNLGGWDVNEDETDRRPTPTVYGLKFSGTDLIHHAANVALDDLEPGSYVVHGGAAPDQDSFFSVEVRDAGTGAYGTLRWNKTTGKWDLVTNTASYSKDDPADFVGVATKWGEITVSAKVVSFGIGYTQNPPGTVDTVISAVKFGGVEYGLNCPAPTTGVTTKPTTIKPTTSAPTVKPTTSSPVAGGEINPDQAGPSLPVTGPSTGVILWAAVAFLLIGVAAFVAAARVKRRAADFEA